MPKKNKTFVVYRLNKGYPPVRLHDEIKAPSKDRACAKFPPNWMYGVIEYCLNEAPLYIVVEKDSEEHLEIRGLLKKVVSDLTIGADRIQQMSFTT